LLLVTDFGAITALQIRLRIDMWARYKFISMYACKIALAVLNFFS